MKRTTRATRTALGVVALALLAGCGDEVATQRASSPSLPNVSFEGLAEAERWERRAHLDGQAWSYMREPRQTVEGSEFVPGSRHMPAR